MKRFFILILFFFAFTVFNVHPRPYWRRKMDEKNERIAKRKDILKKGKKDISKKENVLNEENIVEEKLEENVKEADLIKKSISKKNLDKNIIKDELEEKIE